MKINLSVAGSRVEIDPESGKMEVSREHRHLPLPSEREINAAVCRYISHLQLDCQRLHDELCARVGERDDALGELERLRQSRIVQLYDLKDLDEERRDYEIGHMDGLLEAAFFTTFGKETL